MAKQITTNGELTLQRQARRRLIGAIALMAGVVIFLPMIFDPDPATTVSGDIELRIPQPVTPPVQQAVEALAPPPAEPVAQPVIKSPPQTKAEPAPAPAPVATAPAKSGPSAGWVVQVGAYSNVDAASQMAANLKQRGYPVYTEQAGAMVRVRVGSYPSREAAEKIRVRLEAIGLHPNVLNPE